MRLPIPVAQRHSQPARPARAAPKSFRFPSTCLVMGSLLGYGTAGAQQTAPPGTGLRLPADIAQQISAMLEIQVAQQAPSHRVPRYTSYLGAARTSAQTLDAARPAAVWQWEKKGVFGDALDQGMCDSCFVYAPLGIVQASWMITRYGNAAATPVTASKFPKSNN